MLFAGFNGFGQFGESLKKKAESPTSLDVRIPIAEVKLLSASWSYNAFASGKTLVLTGYIMEKAKNLLVLEASDDIIQISTCDRFCLTLLQNGKLFKTELNSKNLEMIEIKFADVSTRKRSILGEKQEIGFVDQVTHIACGSTIAVAIMKSNIVYNIPTKVHQFPHHVKIAALQCGFEHALLLTGNGDLYTWGNGLRGQLGLDIMRVEQEPTLIEALAGVKIICIAADGWHNAAVSVFGDLYTWGFNSNGQLGIQIFKDSEQKSVYTKNPSVYPLPQLIDLPDCCSSDSEKDKSCSVVKVFTGARHTILQLSCGTFLAAGWNAHGQLGLSDNRQIVDQFEKLAMESSENILDIICGPWCTIFFTKCQSTS